jgi:hypothetical protein
MPSSPQVIATYVVFDYLVSTAGAPLANRPVVITLDASEANTITPITYLAAISQTVTTDQNGYWQANLIPNTNINPANTVYTVQPPGLAAYQISVPGGPGPYQSSAILVNQPSALSPATTGLTGPITITGNESVTGNLTVTGTTTLGQLTAGATTLGAAAVGGDLTIASAFRLLFGAAISKIVPGATSLSLRNHADSADNLILTDAGAATVRNGLTLTAGDAVVTAGRLLLSAAASKIVPGATSLSLRNNADSADNLLLTNAGLVTLRNAVQIPTTAAGSVVTSNYGSVPVKLFDSGAIGAAQTNFTISSIPGTFQSLLLIVHCQTDQASSQALGLQFNGDVGNNYNWGGLDVASTAQTTAAANGATATNSIRIGTVAVTVGGLQCWIHNYVSTSLDKTVTSQSSSFFFGSNFTSEHFAGNWAATAAITSITLGATAGKFNTGSRCVLWGYP